MRKVLAGMWNKSALELDLIKYFLIKQVVDLKLGRGLIVEVVENLLNRIM